ncbi:enhanced serine sensitivity protein SseB C-terminal domain-containing protein [Clostridium sp. CM027]|uniref:enhanced serine sensitivity protein SseB C-terminal domain-containing protein n=1 Tax=Clostridium sp. CM027 TaxID=2849865 RepID=UPI001C6EDAC9|nr:enhanced serine sensitivity protein SseB C-terminal domain-containing protein [Clostridium sp. CM027]MBW9144014.1 enhanced serine sensitivity protein SseB C-terminal domain-containing protein [Clostridium sp. CM027]UVE41331.1 enhanced serine sensitivity protein SseB C-terminal domain-containing protein [Clostridium sp. CM027]
MKKQKNVQAAYLQLMVKESEQSYLVVDFMGYRREIFDGISNVAMSHLKGIFIDLVPYDSEFGSSTQIILNHSIKRKNLDFFKIEMLIVEFYSKVIKLFLITQIPIRLIMGSRKNV